MSEENQNIIEDWWSDSQIGLVTDRSKIWTKKVFKSSSGFWTPIEGGNLLSKTSEHDNVPSEAIIDESAWDHEHCELCFATISDRGDNQREGYTDSYDWLCSECYSKYLGKLPDKSI